MQNRKSLVNYYSIANIVEIKDVLSNFDILYENGILILEGIINFDILDRLKKFEINQEIPSLNTENFSFSLFPPRRLKAYNIAIKYTEESKELLKELSKIYIPSPEFCTSLYYIDNKENSILEWENIAEEAQIFLSINIMDKKIRKFCKSIDIDSYCTKFYSYSRA